MKKLSLLCKFEVGITFIPFLIIILLSGSYKLFFTYFLITLIHELGHVITAILFKVKIYNIKLSAFGFNASIEDIEYLPIYKQILIIIMGPLTYFLSLILIEQLYLHEVISLVMYYRALATNKYIFIFNLLPIFPLDGGRLLKLLFDNIFTYKLSKFFLYVTSLIFIIFFVIYTKECKQLLMYVFLVINFLINILTLKKQWKMFLLKRFYISNNYKEKIHQYKDLFFYKNNYLISKKNILSEKEAILELLKE